MVTLADRQYTLTDFENIRLNNDIQISVDIQKKIDYLTSKVGAPTYSKTPNFKKGRRNRSKGNPENWAVIRNFKTTKIAKETEGIGKMIDDIILLLNKITKTNYTEMSKNIIQTMKNIDAGDEENLLKLGEAIFLIGSSNEFYSKLYSRLYKDLIEEFPFMSTICMKTLFSFAKLFETIEYIPPEDDYDKFCAINKDNEKRRALSCFFANLMLLDIIEKDKIYQLINNLIEKQNQYFADKSKKKIIDEISENIFIFIKLGKYHFIGEKEWESIYNHITLIANASTSLYPALSNKTIFKFMDIAEMI